MRPDTAQDSLSLPHHFTGYHPKTPPHLCYFVPASKKKDGILEPLASLLRFTSQIHSSDSSPFQDGRESVASLCSLPIIPQESSARFASIEETGRLR